MSYIKVDKLFLKYPVAGVGLKKSIINAFSEPDTSVKEGFQLENVSFSIFDGQRMAILGENGSGKTSLLNVLSGIYEPNRGSVIIEGSRSSFVNIGAGMNHQMTGEQNARLFALYRGFRVPDIDKFVEEVEIFCALGDKFYQPIKTYSSGMLVRLAFAISTEGSPDVIIMDEWLSAGDHLFIEKATNRMNNVVMNANVMVLATHSMELAREWCDCALVLRNGEGKYYSAVEEAIESYLVG